MPETIDYDPAVHTTNSEDAKMHVIFYMSFTKNESKSKEEGRAVFDDEPYTKIFTPGDRTNIIDRPTRQSDKMRWPAKWAQFSNNQDQRASGTPLVEWPIISRGQAEELKFLGFMTVEQVADVGDHISYMGIQSLKQKAKAFLEIAKGNTAPMEKMSSDLKESQALLKVQAESITAMQEQIKLLTDKIVKST